MALSEDVPKRFDAYGWHTQRVADGNDLDAIEAAIEAALARRPRPSLIAVRTHIGYGSPNKQDSQKAHGSPLGPDEVRLTKEAYGWDPDRTFYVPGRGPRPLPRAAIAAGEALVADWEARSTPVPRRLPGRGRRVPPPDRPAARAARTAGTPTSRPTRPGPRSRPGTPARTRSPPLAPRLPELFGGAADLSESNLTDVKGEPNFSADEAGRNLRFGVREHAMGGDRQRHRLPRRVHPVLRHVPDLQRLHARRGPAGGAVRAPRHLRLDPRFGRARRGRPDPPAGRALRRPPGDPEPVVRPARRRQRDRRGLGARGRADRRAGRPGADPPEAADPAGHGPSWPARASPAAATSCARRPAERPS